MHILVPQGQAAAPHLWLLSIASHSHSLRPSGILLSFPSLPFPFLAMDFVHFPEPTPFLPLFHVLCLCENLCLPLPTLTLFSLHIPAVLSVSHSVFPNNPFPHDYYSSLDEIQLNITFSPTIKAHMHEGICCVSFFFLPYLRLHPASICLHSFLLRAGSWYVPLSLKSLPWHFLSYSSCPSFCQGNNLG